MMPNKGTLMMNLTMQLTYANFNLKLLFMYFIPTRLSGVIATY